MAAHSNRTPSPLSLRPSNPISRISENNQTIRKSFTKPSVVTSNARRFDPITPANSPSDFMRSRSLGKEFTASNLRDHDEKENEEIDHNSKATRLRSPAKGLKNFMAPTISAASKFTPSPRKKALVERNNPVRTSVSLSDGKVTFFSSMSSDDTEIFESKSEMGCDHNLMAQNSWEPKAADPEIKEPVHEDPPLIPKNLKKVTFVDVASYSDDPSEPLEQSGILDSSDTCELEKTSSSPNVSHSIAPLDADPSLPPYDPKTNYLSPRPQFLYYKPNPRIEIMLNREKGLDPDEFKRLDDVLMAEVMSESFSDFEVTEDSQTEDSQKEEEEVTASSDMVLGVEETEASSDMVLGVEETEASESLPVSTVTFADATSIENVVQKRKKKPRISSKLISFSIVMLFLLAWGSISINYSPAFDHVIIKDLSLSDLSNLYHQSSFANSVKESFHRVNMQVNLILVELLSSFSNIIGKFDNGGTRGSLQFVNLTELQNNNVWNRGQFEDLAENVEEKEMETEMDEFEKELLAEVDSGEDFEDEVGTQDDTAATEDSSSSLNREELETSFQVQEEEDMQEEFECSEMSVAGHEYSSEMLPTVSQDESRKSEVEEVEVATDRTEYSSEMLTTVWQDESRKSEVEEVEVKVATDRTESKDLISDKKLASDRKIITEIETVEIESDRSKTDSFHCDSSISSSASDDTILLEGEKPLVVEFSDEEDVQDLVSMESASEKSEEKLSTRLVTGAVSLFVVLSVVAAYIYKIKRNPNSSNAVVQTEVPMKNKTATDHFHEEQRFSPNWQMEDDLIGESCPSEMSSFQNTASYSAKVRSASDKKSRKNSKRESLASSTEFSVGSASYGSFTTFERIPIKHANGGEEIVTPVRRSSRINKQVTSP